MSITTSEAQSTSLNIDIDKYGQFYADDSKCMKKLKSCLNVFAYTRKCWVLVLFTIYNILVGFGIVISICLTVFHGTHWKYHELPRKIFRTCAVSVHHIVLPSISAVFMWIFYYKKSESNTSTCCSCNWIDWFRKKISTGCNSCSWICIRGYENLESDRSKCCSCDWIKKTVWDCTVFRRTDGLKQNGIPKINMFSQEEDVESDHRDITADLEKIYCNVGRYSLIGLQWIIPILYTVHCSCEIVGAIIQLRSDTGREPTENYTSCDILFANLYSGFTLGFYFPNFILMIPVLIYVINIYFDMMYKTEWLSQCLITSYKHKEPKESILYVLQFFQSSMDKAGRTRFWANLFASFYIMDVALFNVGYVLYVLIEELHRDYRRWTSIATLSLSGFLLLIIMVVTNKHLDNLKSTTLLMPSIFEISKKPNTETLVRRHSPTELADPERNDRSSAINDVSYLQTIMNYYDSYAAIFGYAPHTTALVAIILTKVITFSLPYILKAHGLIPSNKAMNTYLDIH